MKKFLVVGVGVCLLALLGVMASQAQSGDCGGASGCVDSSQFDTEDDRNNWTNGSNTSTELSWLAVKDFGWGPWLSHADGVLVADNYETVVIEKVILLSPGRYHLVMRVASAAKAYRNTFFIFYTPPGGVSSSLGMFDIEADKWTVITSESFQSEDFGETGFSIDLSDYVPNMTAYFDYIYIVREGDATPIWNGTGTPATPTVIPVTATPFATVAPYCVPVTPSATPGPGQFGTPTATVTPTVDPQSFFYYDTFDSPGVIQNQNSWMVQGHEVAVQINTGHNGLGAVLIPYSLVTETFPARDALVFNNGTVITPSFFVDGWAHVDFAAEGVTYNLEIWAYDADYDYWSMFAEVPVGSSAWYPFHVGFYDGDPPVMVEAIAFVASRSDGQTVGHVYLDDVSIYRPESNGPRCDGSVPPGADNFSDHPIGGGGGMVFTDTTGIYVPQSKPCPGNISRPNNFWGALFAGLTFFLDASFAGTPYHNAGVLRGASSQFFLSPVGGFVVLLSSLFDFTWPLTAAAACAVMLGVYLILLGWQFLRKGTVE